MSKPCTARSLWPATVMVTCYPCAPFVGIALFMLRRILKRASNGAFFTDIGLNDIRVISVCCAVIAVITLIAGRYYLPFYIVGGTFAFFGTAFLFGIYGFIRGKAEQRIR